MESILIVVGTVTIGTGWIILAFNSLWCQVESHTKWLVGLLAIILGSAVLGAGVTLLALSDV